jgi:hypothetical protein
MAKRRKRPSVAQQTLAKLYYTFERAGSLGGVSTLWRAVKNANLQGQISYKDVQDFLSGQEVHYLYRQSKYKYPRNKTKIPGPEFQVSADVWQLERWREYNDGFIYVLLAVDCFSRKVAAVPMRNKFQQNIIDALKVMLAGGLKFKLLFTDRVSACHCTIS